MKLDLSKLRNKSWTFARKYLLDFGLVFIAKRLSGPWGFLAAKLFPFLLDKVIKPAWLWSTRKVVLVKDRIIGKKTARSKRDANTPDDYLDSLNSDK